MSTRGTDYFIGCVSAAAPDATSYMEEPEAPGNYKKPEAIREYKERKREEFAERAALQAVTGTLVAVHLEGEDARPILSVASERPGEVSCALVKWFMDTEFEDYPLTVGGSFTATKRLWGFGIDHMLRIAGLEALRYGGYWELSMPPLRLWYRNNGAYDPYEILTGSAERKAVSLFGLCRYLGLGVTPAELDPTQSNLAHGNLARVARLLCLRTGLTFLR